MSGYISVLLQKSTAAGGWGFLLGSEPPSPNVIVTQVDTECVASQLLEPGDRVLELEGFEANRLTQRQMDGILTGPSNKLSMVLLKRRRGDIGPLYSTREIRKEDFSSREEQRSRYEQRGDYNYYELSSQTERSEKSQEKTKDEEKQDKGMEGVYEAKPFVNHTPSQQDSSMKTDELRSQHTHEKKSSRIEESQSSAQKITEEITSSSKVKKEVSEMEEKKKSSSSFWTEPPKDLRSAVRNSKFWKSPGGHFVSTSTIFNQLNNLHNEQKRTNPREEKRQFWENCNRGKFGRDSPGSKSDGASGEKREEDLRSRSCEPEHLKPNNPFNSYETYKTTSPNNPFYSQSPTNPFCEEYKESYLEETVDGCMVSSETKYTSSSSQEEPKTTASVPTASTDIATEVKTEEKRQVSDFNTNREFFERATSVPTVSCVKNAQDLVSERMSPSGFSGLKKPSDFINQIRAENQRSQSLQPENKRQEREKSVPRALPKDYRPSGPGNGFVRASSSDNDRRCFTETSYEKVTRVGTPYENVESAWRREYRVATPSGFYDNNFEEILKEDSFLRSPEKVPARNLGPEEAVEEAFRLLTMREGLEPVYGRYFGST